jgi:hypothetical protein
VFSNDQNIEYIAQFVEEAKHWFELKTKYSRLSAVDKIVRILTALLLFVVISIILVIFMLFLSFALAKVMADVFDSEVIGYLCVSAVYLLLLIVVYLSRHALIERPLVHFLMSVLAEDVYSEELLDNNKEV